jgi:uncharacterized protein (UPF0276 family)
MSLPELGVGITYFPGLEPVLDRHAGSIQVVEIEPQTFWTRSGSGILRIQEGTLQTVRSFSIPKLVHGVGNPVGGTLPPDPAQTEPMRRTIEILRPAWASEHLNFNRICVNGVEEETLFLLPPRQNAAGVRAAVRSIRVMADVVQMPFAVETPVSYLRPWPGEMEDGRYFCDVVETADCGIVLDLHNLWVNQRNGRQPVEEYLDQIPLDRVWEVHVAGGEDLHDYWLDAHSGPMQEEFYQLASQVLPSLPNLGALIFEMFPSYLPIVGETFFAAEFDKLHRLWDRRGRAVRKACPPPQPACTPANGAPEPGEWECALGRVALGKAPRNDLELALHNDPGTRILQELVQEFRAAYILSALRLSSRLLMLALGEAEFRALMQQFWAETMPFSFACQEGKAFADFLKARRLDVPWLEQVMNFDLAVLAVQIEDQPQTVSFTIAPLPLLRALGAGRMPAEYEEGEYELMVTPDS